MKTSPDKTASAWAVLRVYVKASLKYPGWVALSIGSVLVVQIVNLVVPLYLREIFNTLASHEPSSAIARELVFLIGIIGVLWLVRVAVNYARIWAGIYWTLNVMCDLWGHAFKYLLGHSHNFFASNFSGSLTHQVTKFGRSFQPAQLSFEAAFLPTTFFIIGATTVLSFRHPLLGIVLATWVVLFVAFQIWLTTIRQPLRHAHSVSESRVTAVLADAISNQSNITLFSGSSRERNILRNTVETWRASGIRSWGSFAWTQTVLGFFIAAIEITLLSCAVWLWKEGVLTIGDFVLIQAYLFVLFERLMTLQDALKNTFTAFADAGEMLAVIEMSHDVTDVSNAPHLAISEGSIVLNNVDFYFNQTNPVLEKFNLVIRGGERVALVGPSGAGKSTITKLLLRLYDVAAGEIAIDGQNIAKVTQDSLRNAIAFVPQEPVLFHRTLMENIRYGRRDATDTEVFQAAKQAHCHEFIEKLPLGYETLVGERGVKLSGGERQRVAIARAILKNAPILILDEATSSLDSESESLIQDALKVLMQGKTVIVIAHRLSTIMQMDRIVVIDGGTTVAEGTHDELLAQGGLYQKLWSIQAGGFLQDT